MATEISKLFVSVGAKTEGFDKGMAGMEKRMKAVGMNMTKIGGGILAATGAIGGASLKMAADFDSAMREVNTMMLLNEEDFKSFSGEVKQMSKDMGVDAVKSAKALYQAISAGVPKENAIDFLRVATKAAIGGVTETETAVDGLTSVMNAFKIPMEDAQKVADIMFTTVKGGKTTFEELSASMFQVAPMAASAGIGFDEVSGALATMTKQGVPTRVATTQLRQAIQAMIKPTDEMKSVLEDMGYASGDALLKEKGLSGALEMLRGATGGSNEMLGKMFGSVEGLQAVLALTGDNAKTFSADLDAMKDSTGAATDAFEQMEKSTSRQMEKMQTSFKDMAIGIGTALMPALTKLVKAVTPIIEKIGKWIEENPELTKTVLLIAGAVGGLLVTLGPLLMMLPAIGTAFAILTGPIGLAIAAIAGLIAIGILVWKNWESIVSFFEGIPETIGKAFTTLADIILAPFRAALKGIERGINWLIEQINKIRVDIPSWVPGIGGKGFGFNIPPISLPTFKYGGTVPGAIGQPVPVIAHGGEHFLGAGNRVGATINIYVSGSVVTERELLSFIKEGLLIDKGSNVTLGFT